ncbi:phage holin family protein [Nocardioides campestrisoli]|uniref:phage holin family protein n=1 Tax=Nocardioides campestrisoli TaxID=2736757 RepID=UPI00163D5AA7|nr:phage holin family protein [Nocardioides campestrisoli]
MTDPHTPLTPGAVTPGQAPEPTVGALVHDLTQQVPDLIRSELRLAQAEMTAKGKQAGLGLGMFSAAGLLAFFGLAALITTAIAALALVLPTWAAALIVAAVLFVLAGVIGLLGKKRVDQATPAKPERALGGIKEDIDTVKGGHRG